MTQSATYSLPSLSLISEIQVKVGDEIAARIAAGEPIGRVDADMVIATQPATRDLAKRRDELLENHAKKQVIRSERERKSAA